MSDLDPDTPDQKRLRAVAEEIRTILHREKLGGMFAISSQESSEWMVHFPDWSGLTTANDRVEIQLSSKRPRELETTMHYVASVRDICADTSKVFNDIFQTVAKRIRKAGGSIQHTKWGGEGHGPAGKPDPEMN